MSFVSSTDSIIIKPNSNAPGSTGTITLDTNNSSGNGNIYLKTNGTSGSINLDASGGDINFRCGPNNNTYINMLNNNNMNINTPNNLSISSGNNITINSNNLIISTVNPPTQSAVQPASSDSSNKIPTTAWVQGAISSGGSLSVYSVSYTSNQTIVTPTNCRFIDIQVISYGGNCGDAVVGPPVYYGGSGSGGNMAIISGVSMEAGITLTFTFVATSGNAGYVLVQYTSPSGVINLAKVYNGNKGGNGSLGGIGAGGIPNSTASVLNSNFGSWFSASGNAGVASTLSGSGISIPPALSGTGSACPCGTHDWSAGKNGCGQRDSGSAQGGGIVVITYHKA